MKRLLITTTTLLLVSCSAPCGWPDADQATPREVVLKVRRAAALLADHGAIVFEVLRDNNSEFSWKDTYVFVVDCNADLVMANPAFPQRQGGDIKQHTDYRGKQYGLELCETARQPGGGWVEYIWPRPGGGDPSRKISYVVSVDGHPYQVGAGIYNETVSIAELNRISETRR